MSFYQWHFPGVYYDEVILVNQAYQVLDGQFPLIGNVPYVGALKGYLHAPFVHFFPGSVFWLRAVPIGLSLITAIFYYLLIRDIFKSPKTASVALALFLLHPTLIFSTRVDDGPVSTLLLFEILVLYFLHKGIQTNQLWNFLLAGLFAGLGIWQKAYFLWLIFALFLLAPFAIKITKQRVLHFGIFSAALIIGASCLLLYNALNDWPLLHYSADYDYNLQSLRHKGRNLFHILLGIERYKQYIGKPLSFPCLTLIPFLFSLLFVSHSTANKKVAYLSFALLLLLTVQTMSITVSGFAPRHYVLLFPLFGVPIVALWQDSTGILRKTFTGLIALAILSQGIVIQLYHQALGNTEGTQVWSSAIYEVADYVSANPNENYIAMDWGISASLEFLTANKVEIKEPYWVYPKTEKGLERLLTNTRAHSAHFIFHSPSKEVFSEGRNIFERYLEIRNSKELVLQRFFEAGGEELLIISRQYNRAQ
ncbi:ArnT family glycosyltransferase [Pseudomonadota bacterium]